MINGIPGATDRQRLSTVRLRPAEAWIEVNGPLKHKAPPRCDLSGRRLLARHADRDGEDRERRAVPHFSLSITRSWAREYFGALKTGQLRTIRAMTDPPVNATGRG